MSYSYLDSNNITLNIKPGGPTVVGQMLGDMVVAGRPDGSVYAGSSNKPLLGRTASGEVMLIVNSEFVANILPGGTLRILSGENHMVFRPSGVTLLSSEASGPSSREVVDNIVALGANLMGWSNDYALARVSPVDEIALKTTRGGATRVSQPGRDFSVISKRDGTLYAGTADRPLLARLQNGDILLSLDDDFAAVIHRNGTMAICTTADCVLYAPGRELMISSGNNTERAPKILERLYEFGAIMLAFDQEPDPKDEPVHYVEPNAIEESAVNEDTSNIATEVLDEDSADVIGATMDTALSEAEEPAEKQLEEAFAQFDLTDGPTSNA